MRLPVTFLLPVKNGKDFLAHSLANISWMAGQSDEILVIDDHSDDGSDSILDSFKLSMKNLVVLDNPGSGLVSALNFGIAVATNNLIARVDVDDTYLSNRIDKQLECFNPSTVAVFSDYTFFSTKDRDLGTIYSAVHPLAVSVSLVSSQRTAHPSVVFSREAAVEVGGYRESDFPAEDLSLWLRLSRVGEFRSVPLPLLNYRMNPLGISSTKRSEMLNKKTFLLNEIGLNTSDLGRVENSIPDILTAYENLTNKSERSILLAKDLFSISKLDKNYANFQTLGFSILREELLSGHFLPKTSKLLIEKLKRRYLR